MTDTTKHKNVSLSLEIYNKIDKLRKVIVDDDPTTSRSKVITILVNREIKKLNGKERRNHDKSNT